MIEINFFADHRAKLGESPLWDARIDKLLWVDSVAGKIFRAEVDGTKCEGWTAPSMVGSIALADIGVLAALEDGFYLLDPASVRFDAIALPERGNPDVRFNDGRADRAGRFLAGTMRRGETEGASGKLYRLEPGGATAVLEHGIAVSNALCFSPAGNTLYFADSAAGVVWAYDYDGPGGAAANRRVLIDTMALGSAPDGATVDTAGDLWIAMLQTERLIRVSPQGRVLQTLTHGVGLGRTYSIGAVLLDKADPTKVLARSRYPLLGPRPEERGGYVPNVVYSCGALVANRVLLLPYAVGDRFTAFATAPVERILAKLN